MRNVILTEQQYKALGDILEFAYKNGLSEQDEPEFLNLTDLFWEGDK